VYSSSVAKGNMFALVGVSILTHQLFIITKYVPDNEEWIMWDDELSMARSFLGVMFVDLESFTV
jgi:hypothetical protein